MALAIFASGRKLLALRGSRHDDDAAYQLFSKYTPAVLAVCVVIITPKQFFGSPITCWVPNTWSGNYAQYGERICLLNGTYLIDRPISEMDYVHGAKLNWYAFTPLFIFILIIPFIVPTVLWSALSTQGGIDVAKASEAAHAFQNISDSKSKTEKEALLRHITKNLKVVQVSKVNYPTIVGESRPNALRRCCFCFSKVNSSYLANLWLATKFLFIVAILFNTFFLASILGRGFLTLGARFVFSFTSERSIIFEHMFPLYTICDFTVVNNLDTAENKRMHCLLSMNVFNEKIFVFIWFWFLFLFFVAVLDLVFAFLFINNPRVAYEYFKHHLPTPKNQTEAKCQLRFFAQGTTADSKCALRLMSCQVDHRTTSTMVTELYNHYMGEVNRMQMNEGAIDAAAMAKNEESSSESVDAIVNREEMAALANAQIGE